MADPPLEYIAQLLYMLARTHNELYAIALQDAISPSSERR